MVATLILRNEHIKQTAHKWVNAAPPDTVVKFYKPKRTISQNDKMWAMLTEVSTQADLHGVRHNPDGWKIIFMDSLGYETKFILGMNHNPIPAGFKSSKLSKDQMSDMIELMYMFGANNDVVFNDVQ